ncbi:MAG: hypothetical protein HIU85_10905 [Proteobacteria bacterium]|nr:hypothetical protein [Pseudomonadota bacterium]
MSVRAATLRSGEDPLGNVLKWTLLVVAIVTFATLGWSTVATSCSRPALCSWHGTSS